MSRSLNLARLAGILPLPLVERLARAAFHQVLARHPALLERLDGHINKRFGFLATDLDIAFVISPASRSLLVMRGRDLPRTGLRAPQATVSGPLRVLLSLLEGSADGDAEFFVRALAVSGDMEAVLALRNALDDADIDLPNDLGALAGPLSPLVARLGRAVRSLVLKAKPWN
jgi:predicted lipid carrier protein YhbT